MVMMRLQKPPRLSGDRSSETFSSQGGVAGPVSFATSSSSLGVAQAASEYSSWWTTEGWLTGSVTGQNQPPRETSPGTSKRSKSLRIEGD